MSIEEWKKSMDPIGWNIAGTYGADYEDCELLDTGDIRFYCDDHGDKFYCDIHPSDIDDWR